MGRLDKQPSPLRLGSEVETELRSQRAGRDVDGGEWSSLVSLHKTTSCTLGPRTLV